VRIPLHQRLTWPQIIVGLLGTHATLILMAVSVAIAGPGRGVVPDYYSQAVDYDQHKANQAASAALGWRLKTTPGKLVDDRGQRLLVVTLEEPDGRPIVDADVALRLIRRVDGQTLELRPIDDARTPGRYQAIAPLPRAGVYQADWVVTRGDEKFVHHQLLQLVGGIAPAMNQRPAPSGADQP
jgi:hypothetical protein